MNPYTIHIDNISAQQVYPAGPNDVFQDTATITTLREELLVLENRETDFENREMVFQDRIHILERQIFDGIIENGKLKEEHEQLQHQYNKLHKQLQEFGNTAKATQALLAKKNETITALTNKITELEKKPQE